MIWCGILMVSVSGARQNLPRNTRRHTQRTQHPRQVRPRFGSMWNDVVETAVTIANEPADPMAQFAVG